MATINQSHSENGGVVLFNGELILLYCDAVNSDVEGKGSVKGRIFLTTHRFILVAQPVKQNPNLISFSAPFFSLFDLSLEQPIFGANYIKGKVKNSDTNAPPYVFKLKFNKGGAIEFGQAMEQAAKRASSAATQSGFSYNPPPAYTPSAAQYYEAPDNVYQPGYNAGFALPNEMFSTPPPVGFVYTMDAPPPYPGLGPTTPGQNNPSGVGFSAPHQPPAYEPNPPSNPAFSSPYPMQTGGVYPNLSENQTPYPQAPGFPTNAASATAAPPYPQAPGYPTNGPPASAAPPYPQAPGYPTNGPPASAAPPYPQAPGFPTNGASAPPAPSGPPPIGFAPGGNIPPSYEDATKKMN